MHCGEREHVTMRSAYVDVLCHAIDSIHYKHMDTLCLVKSIVAISFIKDRIATVYSPRD